MYRLVCLLFALSLSLVGADLTVLSDLAANNSYSDVHSVYVSQGYYVMLYVGSVSVSEPNYFGYSLGLYQLIDGKRLVRRSPTTSDSYNIKSHDGNLRLTAEGNEGSSWTASIIVCSSADCGKFYIEQDTITYIQTVSWCNTGIDEGDQLLSVTDDLGYDMSIVLRGTELLGFLCLPNGQERNLKFVCSDKMDRSTQIHSVQSTITDTVNVFALLSNGEETALCSFSQSISILTESLNTMQQSSIIVFNDYKPIAMAVAGATEDHVVFVSSLEGRVGKVYVQANAAYKINEFTITPEISDVFSEMLLEDDRLMVATKKRVILLDVEQTCEQHLDLCACRAPKDPKCGWCVSSNKCSNNASCNSSSVWIKADPGSNNVCWNATTSPKSVSRHQLEPLGITVIEDMGADKFGSASAAYRCIYGTPDIHTLVSSAVDQSLTCDPPDAAAISQLPDGTLEIPVVIYYILGQDYLPLLVHYKMVICSDISNCGDCVNSHDSCTWCINDHKCTATVDRDCPNSIATGTRSIFGDVESCPAITELLTAPVNEAYLLIVPMKNLPTPGPPYFCRMNIEGGGMADIIAERNGDSISCSSYRFGSSLQSESFYLNSFTVAILFGDSKWELAKQDGMIYDCSYQSVCTQCVQVRASANCVWCPDSNQCLYNQCPVGSPIKSSCPSLEIFTDQIKPRDIPVEGEIILTIPGRGLILGDGYNMASIDISDQACRDIVPGPNVPSSGGDEDILQCTVPQVSSHKSASLDVVIDGISWHKSSFINYYDPDLKSLSVYNNSTHSYGPVAGGTDIKISGNDLSQLASTEWLVEFVDSMKPSYDPVHLINCLIEKELIRCKTPPVGAVGRYIARLKFTKKHYARNMTNSGEMFEYRPNSTITDIYPREVIAWGGKVFTVSGTHFDSVSGPMVSISQSGTPESCTVITHEQMTCTYPQFTKTGTTQIVIIMDGIDVSSTTINATVTDNPTFDDLAEGMDKQDNLILPGSNIGNVDRDDIKVFVGGQPCEITQKEAGTMICTPPDLEPDEPNTAVTINIYGKERFMLGSINYNIPEMPSDGPVLTTEVIGSIAGGGTAAVIVMVLVAVLLFKRSRYHKQRYESMVKHVDQLECNSRHEIKQAFAELQTDMSDLMSDLNVTGIPYWDYKNFTFKILFPGQTDHPSLHKLLTKRKVAVMQALDMFEHLIQNKDFLISFIHTLEAQPTFTMPDRVHLAALLMLTLQHKMDYITTVIKELLADLIKTSIRDKHPKLLLRRSENVVEKMLTHWLSLCLYKYLQDHAGTPLFMLFKAIKHQIEKGPVDALTGEARYSLSQERLLRLTVDTNPMTIDVLLENGERLQCKVNDIDTTTQVKEKILDAIYKNQAYSLRPCAIDYNLEWHHGMVGVPICDEDLTSQTVNGWKRLNTLAHYSIPDNAMMRLVSRHRPNSLRSDRSLDTDKLCDTLRSNRGVGTPRGTLNRNGALSTSNLQDHYVHSHISLWHLSKSSASQTLPKDRQQTMMSEIFLTRLLKTKGTLQEFIDALFQTIFCADNLPPTIKFLFDFLDQEANKHGITDPEVVHVWKNNSLNLRFWVNIIKNPEFVFDIHKSEVVDASLSTIAQTFIDSCAMTESDFGVDAPINKLLFARDRPRYRKMLQNMYSEIRNKPPVPEQTLNAHLNELSKMYPREVYRNSALKEIWQFAQRYQSQILQDLEDNFPKHRNPNLSSLLQDIHSTLDERHTQLTDYV